MLTLSNGLPEVPLAATERPSIPRPAPETNGQPPPGRVPDPERLRHTAWEIGEQQAAAAYTPTTNHVGLAAVAPYQGFAHWRILPAWVEQTARRQGEAWSNCRLVIRLYDVSYIQFNGLNAHRLQDHTLPGLCGELFFKLPRPGTWELAEVGFLLRSGEFIPAARSQSVAFPPDSASQRSGHTAALLVGGRRRVEEIGNVWDQEKILRERRQPRLRQPLRCAALAFASQALGQQGGAATFVHELAAGTCSQGHEAHVFVPATADFATERTLGSVSYHPLHVRLDGTPVEQARAFAQAAASRLGELPPFDVIHLHEWMAGLGSWHTNARTVLSLTSIEATRRNGAPPSVLSQEIAEAERQAVRAAACVLTPPWLRDKAVAELGVAPTHVRAFPMDGRLPNEWEAPLDFGQVKMGIGHGPFDRLLLFVGPLEHASGGDLLLEALPVLLQRAGNVRVAFVGGGNQNGSLQQRAHQLGVAHAVRFLGHREGPELARLLRAAEALTLPSRYRVPQDDAVVELARRAGRPVVTTHGGPAHLVRHEENGLVTYDNPGSMVWALDRILGDPAHAERMGRNGRRSDGTSIVWGDVGRHYLEVCAAQVPDLTETSW
jgi:glycosyltransferase involved in cell wall biosynthesis